jgi:hypothetical protein
MVLMLLQTASNANGAAAAVILLVRALSTVLTHYLRTLHAATIHIATSKVQGLHSEVYKFAIRKSENSPRGDAIACFDINSYLISFYLSNS